MTARVVALGLAGLLAATGCAVGNQLVAGRGEYRLYRETRLAPTVEGRLAAANRYLRSEPDGRFAGEVKAWFAEAEPAYVQAAWSSLPRLRAYVENLADGPSIERVKARIEELESAQGLAARKSSHREQRLRSMEENLERAAEQRQAYVEELRAWLAALGSVTRWQVPLAELDQALFQRLGGPAFADSCLPELCVKAMSPRFALPVEGRLVPRESRYSIELVLDAGKVVTARLRGRELFSRLAEALDLRPVSFADPQSRAEAIARGITVVEGALEARYPAEACSKPAIAPVVLERSCNGLRVVATAALETGEDDVVAFAPEAPPEAPAKAPAKGQKAPEKKPSAPAGAE